MASDYEMFRVSVDSYSVFTLTNNGINTEEAGRFVTEQEAQHHVDFLNTMAEKYGDYPVRFGHIAKNNLRSIRVEKITHLSGYNDPALEVISETKFN
jgi:hypothetical protein